jgi:hypothetical protein
MKALALLADRLVSIPIDLDRADLEALLEDETNAGRRTELGRLKGQAEAGPAQLILELDLASSEVRDLLRRALTNKNRVARSLDNALVARTRSWPLPTSRKKGRR